MIKHTIDIHSVGSKVLFIGGVHGDELTSIYSLMRLNEELQNPDVLNTLTSIKQITILNMVNMPGLENKCRDFYGPTQSNDLNRQFITDDNYDMENVVKTLKREISKHNIIIDVHSSPNIFNCALIDIDETCGPMAKYFESLDIPYAARYCKNSTIKKYCMKDFHCSFDYEKIGMTIELNGLGQIDFTSASSAYNMLLKILQNPPQKLNKIRYHISEMIYIKCADSGFVIMEPRPTSFVTKGEIIAKTINYDLKLKHEYLAPCDGYIIEYTNGQYMLESESIFSIQPKR